METQPAHQDAWSKRCSPPAQASTSSSGKAVLATKRKYECHFCNRIFSRSERRSQHERSHTQEPQFKCVKCRSTFVSRRLLLRHDRTVHVKDGSLPLRRAGPNIHAINDPSKSSIDIDTPALEQLEESTERIFDAEAAAVLVADLERSDEDSVSKAYSPHNSSIMESSATYPPGNIALPQVHWEGFKPQSVTEPKAHFTAPNSSGSFGCQQSFTSESALQLNSDQLPPIGRQSRKGLVPILQSLVNSLPNSAAGTPIPPSSWAAEPQAGFKIPQVSSDDELNAVLGHICSADSDHAIPDGFHLPDLDSCNRYLSTYFDLFHHNLPFLHPTSFNPTSVASPLLLAVLSIGALYAFDPDQACMLHIASKVLVSQFLQNRKNFSSLWAIQCSLLNMIFASWSGDHKGLEWACSMKNLLNNMVSRNQYGLKRRQEARGTAEPTNSEWVEDEGCRRTFYAFYVFFGLLTLSYNHDPAINYSAIDYPQLPSAEALWNLQVADEACWQEHLKKSNAATFLEAHDNLFRGKIPRYSAFGARIMINAVFLRIWHHNRSSEDLWGVANRYQLRRALETWEESVNKFEADQGHPLLFNAKAMYRNARARLEVDLKMVQETMRYQDPCEVAAAMLNARDCVNRSSEIIEVIEECYNCIKMVVLQGVRWDARTSPTNWSVEHSLCGLDMILILSLWLSRLEHDEEPANREELALYNKVRELLIKDLDETYTTQLSSAVARLWGSMLDEVLVWGITGLMGESFKLHSQALVSYVDGSEASSNVSTPSMTSQAPFGNVDVKDNFPLALQEGCSQPSLRQSMQLSKDTKKSPSLASIADEDWTRETADFKAFTEASDPCSGGSSREPSSARSSGQADTTQNEPPNPDGCIKSWICNTNSPVLTGDIEMAESRASDSDSEEDSIDLCSDSFAWTECSEPSPEWDPFGEVVAALKREYIGTLLSPFLPLQRQCPVDTASDERDSSSSNGSANGKRRDTSSPPSTDTGSRPSKRRNINGAEDNSDEDEEDNHQKKVPSTITEKNLVNGLIFACPFVKRFPDRYRQCYSHNLLTISRVKFHLRRGRYHHLPLYCPRCSETFEDEKLRDEHIRMANCPKKPPRRWDGITQSQSKQLSKRTSSKKTEEENWYDIYKIIFPGEPLPSSPYIDVSLSGELSAFREHELTQGPSIWREILRTRLPSHLQQHLEELQSFHTSFYPEAISVLYQGWASRNQQTTSLPSQSNTQETSIPTGSNDIMPGVALDSPPRSDSAIGNSVSGSSVNERRPEQHQLEQPGHELEQITAQAESQLMLQPSPMYQTMPPYPTPAQLPPQMPQSQTFSNHMGQGSLAETPQHPFQTPQMEQLVPFTGSDDLLHPIFTGPGGSMGPVDSVASQFHYQPYGDSFGYTQYPGSHY